MAGKELSYQHSTSFAQVDGAAVVVGGCVGDGVGFALGRPLHDVVDAQSCLSCESDMPSAHQCDDVWHVSALLRLVYGFWEKGMRMAPGVVRYLLMKYMYRIGN